VSRRGDGALFDEEVTDTREIVENDDDTVRINEGQAQVTIENA